MKSLPVAIIACLDVMVLPVFADPFERLVAHGWVWKPEAADTCEDGEYYSASANKTTTWVETKEPRDVRGTHTDRAEYTVLGHGPHHIDMFLHLEKWRDSTGDLTWWRLAFTEAGAFVSIASNCQAGRTTPPMTPYRLLS